jgi:hypothetical protein
VDLEPNLMSNWKDFYQHFSFMWLAVAMEYRADRWGGKFCRHDCLCHNFITGWVPGVTREGGVMP